MEDMNCFMEIWKEAYHMVEDGKEKDGVVDFLKDAVDEDWVSEGMALYILDDVAPEFVPYWSGWPWTKRCGKQSVTTA